MQTKNVMLAFGVVMAMLFSAILLSGPSKGDLLVTDGGAMVFFENPTNETYIELNDGYNTNPGVIITAPTVWANASGDAQVICWNKTTYDHVYWVNETGQTQIYFENATNTSEVAFATTIVDHPYQFGLVGLNNGTLYMYNGTTWVGVITVSGLIAGGILGFDGWFVAGGGPGGEDVIDSISVMYEDNGPMGVMVDIYYCQFYAYNFTMTGAPVSIDRYTALGISLPYWSQISLGFGYDKIFMFGFNDEMGYSVVWAINETGIGYDELFNSSVGTTNPDYSAIKPLSNSTYMALMGTNTNISMMTDGVMEEIDFFPDNRVSDYYYLIPGVIKYHPLLSANNDSFLVGMKYNGGLHTQMIRYSWDMVEYTLEFGLNGQEDFDSNFIGSMTDGILFYSRESGGESSFLLRDITTMGDVIPAMSLYYYPENITTEDEDTIWITDFVEQDYTGANYTYPEYAGIYMNYAITSNATYVFFTQVNATLVDTDRVDEVTLINSTTFAGRPSPYDSMVGFSNTSIGELNGSVVFVYSTEQANTSHFMPGSMTHNVTVATSNGTTITNVTLMYTRSNSFYYTAYDNDTLYIFEYLMTSFNMTVRNYTLYAHSWNGTEWTMNQTVYELQFDMTGPGAGSFVANVYSDDGEVYVNIRYVGSIHDNMNISVLWLNETDVFEEVDSYTLPDGYTLINNMGNNTILQYSAGGGVDETNNLSINGYIIDNATIWDTDFAGINLDGEYFAYFAIVQDNMTIMFKTGSYEISTTLGPLASASSTVYPQMLPRNYTVGDNEMLGAAIFSAPTLIWNDEHPCTIPEMLGTGMAGIYVYDGDTVLVQTLTTETDPLTGGTLYTTYLYEVNMTTLRTGDESMTFDLLEGWNLVSIPTDELTSEDIFVEAEGIVTSFAIRLSNGTYEIALYEMEGREVYNVTSGMGFYLYATEDFTLEVIQIAVENITYNLSEGWNLVGMPFGYEEEVNSFIDLDTNLTTISAVVSRFDDGSYQFYIVDFSRGTPFYVETFKGYFIYCSEDNVVFTIDTA